MKKAKRKQFKLERQNMKGIIQNFENLSDEEIFEENFEKEISYSKEDVLKILKQDGL